MESILLCALCIAFFLLAVVLFIIFRQLCSLERRTKKTFGAIQRHLRRLGSSLDTVDFDHEEEPPCIH